MSDSIRAVEEDELRSDVCRVIYLIYKKENVEEEAKKLSPRQLFSATRILNAMADKKEIGCCAWHKKCTDYITRDTVAFSAPFGHGFPQLPSDCPHCGELVSNYSDCLYSLVIEGEG
jgi:hypothetical protein